MRRKMMAFFMILVLTVTLAACGGGGEETTLTGMVVSVDGTVISLVEMDENMSGRDFAQGEMPTMPEGMENFGDFDPGAFEGTMPEGETVPQWGEGEMPQMPGGMTPPDGMEMPEGMTMPENGQMPDFSGGKGGMGSGNFSEDMETKEIDIADAHISLEIDGGKASGSMDDIQPGTFVTITVNGKGKATYVLVSSQSVFGGWDMQQPG